MTPKIVKTRFHSMQAEEVIRWNWPGVIFLLSYGKPVAYKAQDNTFVRTPQYSPTTSRQINRWIQETMAMFHIVAVTPVEISFAEMQQRYNSFRDADYPMDDLIKLNRW